MIHFLALALAAAGPQVLDVVPPKLVGGAPLSSLFSADDYPPEASRLDQQGNVRFRIDIDATGKVSSCEILISSGTPSLDTATCAIIAQRARFEPAHDSSGRAVASTMAQMVAWRLATTYQPSAPWSTRITISFGKDGSSPACLFAVEGPVPHVPPPPTCPADVLANLHDEPPPSLPGASELISETRFAIGAAAPVTLGKGDVLVSRLVININVDENGAVTSCSVGEKEGPVPTGTSCPPLGNRIYYPLRGKDGQAKPFAASWAQTVLAHYDAAPEARP